MPTPAPPPLLADQIEALRAWVLDCPLTLTAKARAAGLSHPTLLDMARDRPWCPKADTLRKLETFKRRYEAGEFGGSVPQKSAA